MEGHMEAQELLAAGLPPNTPIRAYMTHTFDTAASGWQHQGGTLVATYSSSYESRGRWHRMCLRKDSSFTCSSSCASRSCVARHATSSPCSPGPCGLSSACPSTCAACSQTSARMRLSSPQHLIVPLWISPTAVCAPCRASAAPPPSLPEFFNAACSPPTATEYYGEFKLVTARGGGTCARLSVL